jgi:thioredoxin-like negative regulator of GroEL
MKQLVRERRFSEVRALADQLVADVQETGRVVPQKIAVTVLEVLQNGAVFEKLVLVAERLRDHGQDHPRVRLRYAQGLIEAGRITAAIELLTQLKAELEAKISTIGPRPTPEAAVERDKAKYDAGEASGLLGRAYKQLYINAAPNRVEPRTADFDRALKYYQDAYLENTKKTWQGVNVIALMTHQERITSANRRAVSNRAAPIAQQLIETIDEMPKGVWEFATCAEAYLALGDVRKAESALLSYLNDSEIDAFKVRATLRQMRELWLLEEKTPPGNKLLPLLVAKLGELGGEIMNIRPTRELLNDLEAVWGDTRFKPLNWLRNALDRARSVARLGTSPYSGIGTGFVFNGAWIGDKLKDVPLLLTNAHVCTNLTDVLGKWPYHPLRPEETVVTFFETGESQPLVSKVHEVLHSSPPSALDYSLLRLDAVPRGFDISLAADPLELPDNRLNIIGHPAGGDISVSLQDNHIQENDGTYIRYRTPTVRGSSGSPVYDQEWRLVALHHSALKEHQANEGILLGRIIAELKTQLNA